VTLAGSSDVHAARSPAAEAKTRDQCCRRTRTVPPALTRAHPFNPGLIARKWRPRQDSPDVFRRGQISIGVGQGQSSTQRVSSRTWRTTA
jgi:hypothetical protein